MLPGLPRGFYLRSFSRADKMKRERFRPDTCVMRGSGLWSAALRHLPLWSKHFAGDRRGAWPPGPEGAVQCTAQLLSIPSPTFWVPHPADSATGTHWNDLATLTAPSWVELLAGAIN